MDKKPKIISKISNKEIFIKNSDNVKHFSDIQ